MKRTRKQLALWSVTLWWCCWFMLKFLEIGNPQQVQKWHVQFMLPVVCITSIDDKIRKLFALLNISAAKYTEHSQQSLIFVDALFFDVETIPKKPKYNINIFQMMTTGVALIQKWSCWILLYDCDEWSGVALERVEWRGRLVEFLKCFSFFYSDYLEGIIKLRRAKTMYGFAFCSFAGVNSIVGPGCYVLKPSNVFRVRRLNAFIPRRNANSRLSSEQGSIRINCT